MDDKKMDPIDASQGEIVIYQSENGDTRIDVRFVDETVWLTQQQMAELFQSSRTNIVEHIQHIYEYQKYQVQTLSPVEEAYLQTIKDVEKTARKKAKEKEGL